MLRPISIVSPFLVHLSLVLFAVGCADADRTGRWSFAEPSDAGMSTEPDVRADMATSPPRMLEACVIQIGGHDAMAIVGDVERSDTCVSMGFSTAPNPRNDHSELEVRADYWNFRGADLFPAACGDIARARDESVAVPNDAIAGSIVFEEERDGWGAVTVDTRIELPDPPSDFPSELEFSGEEIAISEGADRSCLPGSSSQ